MMTTSIIVPNLFGWPINK